MGAALFKCIVRDAEETKRELIDRRTCGASINNVTASSTCNEPFRGLSVVHTHIPMLNMLV